MTKNPRSFIDFKLYLTCPPDGNSACQVALLPTPEVGETVVPITAPLEERPSNDALQLLVAKDITFGNLVALGQKLANCMLP